MPFTSWTNPACKWSELFYHLCITVHYYVYVFFISFHVIPCPSPPGLTQSVSDLTFSIIHVLLCISTILPTLNVIPFPPPSGLTQMVSDLIFSIIYVLLCIITCMFLYILPCNTMSSTSWTNTACKWSDLFYHLCITVHYYAYVSLYPSM